MNAALTPMTDAVSRGALRQKPTLKRWVRLALVLMVAGWVAVFYTAIALDPYEGDGTARRMETHRQLGLPPCSFKELTGYPCPSCGMTTSFALLLHGDIWNSARANFAGTALATLGLAFIPWALACAAGGRVVWLGSFDMTLFRLCITFLVLLFGRWGLALLITYWQSSG